MNFPCLDGHFWIVRDGKIIDPHFSNYDMICRIRRCDSNKKSYIPAPEITQKIMKSMFKKVLNHYLGDKPFEEQIVEFRDTTKKLSSSYAPVVNRCYQNCLIELAENGGELVFGSLGFKYKNREEYFYEFGGIEYKTIKHFIRGNHL